MKRSFKYFLLLSASFLWRCSSDPEPVKEDLGFMPLTKGFYQEYEVDETRYSISGSVSRRYELKMEVVDSVESSGNYTFVIYLYTRSDASEDWEYMDTWSARSDGNRIVLSDSVASYVKLIVPPSVGMSWDGNLMNTFEEDEYTIISPIESYEVSEVMFEDAVEVVQSDVRDVIVATDVRKEVYAKNVGLIYKEFVQLNYCTNPSCLGQEQVESGITYVQKIKTYGKV